MKPLILVVDDDASLRRVLEYNLLEEGYQVVPASSGEEGLRLFDEISPDLVITDMKMPGISGMQLLSAIRERSLDAMVIIITAFGTIDLAVKAIKSGAYDYITKPYSRDALRITVANALRFKGLATENRRLKSELSDRADFRTIIGASSAMEKVFGIVDRVADTEASVLITGESGTGKELVARSIHLRSSRQNKPFVAINCAAIPYDLLESELFGHVKGAFTGAVRDREGKFQLADGGTIFLDEIGELPVGLQPKLLRVLQEKAVEPVGGTKPSKLDLRILAATNLDIEKAVSEGKFREDLYYRLSVIPIHLPPLRERREDIQLLIKYFCGKHGERKVSFDRECMELMVSYRWPGNVRELENSIERILIMRNGDTIKADDLPEKIRSGASNSLSGINGNEEVIVRFPDDGYSLERLEREAVVHALERNRWNQAAAARFLRIPRHTLIYRMEKYGISMPGKSG